MLEFVPDLLPRFHPMQQRIEDESRIGELILAGDEVENEAGMPLRRSADGHNRDRARVIPIVGRAGGGGASPGTDPFGVQSVQSLPPCPNWEGPYGWEGLFGGRQHGRSLSA